ncbi:Dihydrofolate synthase @ Folylpolyglutamate synthase [hydrothermal vent metagenome]|uniref:tetrahydrofolate synthase n=1 Tax=hydrothermal vent metagenome TaxID=652676 RepID=A0A3B0TPJ0_9ZZZZ
MNKTDKILARLLELHPEKLIDLKLDRVERLLEALGRPQDHLPPIIHVAGTNGKGSTIAHLRAFLESAGKKVHVSTSPHLVRFAERIRLAGELVSERELSEVLQFCEERNKGLAITYFEITTAAAFYLFSRHSADYILLEVGLGGRFDATNVVDNPLGVIITPVSIDHTEFLGFDLASIAHEKAGILKSGAPAIVAFQPDAARRAIEKETEKLGVNAKYGGQDFDAYMQNGRLVYSDESGLLDLPPSRLVGKFQAQNAGVAIAACRYFSLPVSDKDIENGLRAVEWPGRLMALKSGKLCDILSPGQQLWLDGGHNEAAAKVLANSLGEMLVAKENIPLVLIFGAYANKDASGFLAHFKNIASKIITIPLAGDRESWDNFKLAEIARNQGFEASAQSDVMTGMHEARRTKNAFVVICGSLHLAGQALALNQTPLK